MPIPIVAGLAVAAAGAWGYVFGTKDEVQQSTYENSGLNLTTIAGYAIVGGLVFYFGKKLLK